MENDNYSKLHVIQINDLEEFILWMKEQACKLAVSHIGNLFFQDSDKYSNKEIDIEEYDITDDDILLEAFDILIEDTNDATKYYAVSKDVSSIIGNITNKIIYNIMNDLVDRNILEMCWDGDKNDFMWRFTQN
jgi:hypothetical protein